MKVMNIGIIIRNDHGDTFPVALTTQMVSIIQSLLVQIPATQQNIVGPDGRKGSAGQQSIPIIPRNVVFDWDAAYEPMLPDEEKALMEELKAKYMAVEEVQAEEDAGAVPTNRAGPDGKVLQAPLKQIGEDPQNPFNMELDAKVSSGPAPEEKTEPAPDTQTEPPTEQQDVTVKPEALGLSGGAEVPGS